MARGGRRRVRVGAWLAAALLAAAAAACHGTASDSGGRDFASRGRAAFDDTLSGTADRNVQAVALLEAAVAENRKDGESHALLGILRMLRFHRTVTDWHSAGDVAKLEAGKARAALDDAAALLPDDWRVLGFRAAATYADGVINRDESSRAAGLAQLRDASTRFPALNMVTFIGAVAPVVAADDPLFLEMLQHISRPLSETCSPVTLPEACGNAGKAPHNLEGRLALFGDVFAKGGDAQSAEGYYRQALATATASSGGRPWRFRGLVEERLRTVAQRIALYRDDDRSNDPLMLGYGPEACAVCHHP